MQDGRSQKARTTAVALAAAAMLALGGILVAAKVRLGKPTHRCSRCCSMRSSSLAAAAMLVIKLAGGVQFQEGAGCLWPVV